MHQKIDIARQFLIPRAIAAIGDQEIVTFDDPVLAYLIARTSEAGVREFNRHLTHIVYTLNVAKHGGADIVGLNGTDIPDGPVACSEVLCNKLLPFLTNDAPSASLSMYA